MHSILSISSYCTRLMVHVVFPKGSSSIRNVCWMLRQVTEPFHEFSDEIIVVSDIITLKDAYLYNARLVRKFSFSSSEAPPVFQDSTNELSASLEYRLKTGQAFIIILPRVPLASSVLVRIQHQWLIQDFLCQTVCDVESNIFTV